MLLATTAIIQLAILDFVYSQFFCADQVQRCAVIVEQYEKDIMAIKNAAFRQCFRRPACQEERKVYNRCFKESLRAVRAPFNGDIETFDRFSEVANRYRAALDNCFMHSPVPPRNEFAPRFIDEDATYARAIYSTEITDRLWGLPETMQPQLDTLGVCLVKDFALRVFGSGIGRMFSSSDPNINNIGSSCTMEEFEVACYRQYLDANQQYQQLLYNRDYMLKQCVQKVRAQTPCRHQDVSRLRACICSVRDDFERQMQQQMLQCVRQYGLATVAMPLPGPPMDMLMGRSHSGHSNLQPIPVPPMNGVEQVSVVQGEIVNGQCLCACGGGSTKTVLSKMGVHMRSGAETRVFEQPDMMLKSEYWQGFPRKDDPIGIEEINGQGRTTTTPREEPLPQQNSAKKN